MGITTSLLYSRLSRLTNEVLAQRERGTFPVGTTLLLLVSSLHPSVVVFFFLSESRHPTCFVEHTPSRFMF